MKSLEDYVAEVCIYHNI